MENQVKITKIRIFQNGPIGATCLRRRKVEEADKWDFERLGKKYINKNKGFQKIPKLFFRHFFSIFRWRNLKFLEIPDFWWFLLDFPIEKLYKLSLGQNLMRFWDKKSSSFTKCFQATRNAVKFVPKRIVMNWINTFSKKSIFFLDFPSVIFWFSYFHIFPLFFYRKIL